MSDNGYEYKHIKVSPLSLHIGAVISNVDLKKPLGEEVVKEIRKAWVDWKVVFFKGQDLSHSEHISFAKKFGEPTIGHPVFGHDDQYPEIYSVAKLRKGNTTYRGKPMQRPWSFWHTDLTPAINPPTGSILRGTIIPPFGGDTQWTNLNAAYEALSDKMKDMIEDLNAIHQFKTSFNGVGNGKTSDEYAANVKDRILITEHPLVTVHPESKKKVLYISPQFVDRISGLHPRESENLLEFLLEHSVRPEFTVRYRWEEGDIAFWDNRSTAHLAPLDIFDADFDRQLYRITLVGDIPVGVNGRKSNVIEGLPILSAAEELATFK